MEVILPTGSYILYSNIRNHLPVPKINYRSRLLSGARTSTSNATKYNKVPVVAYSMEDHFFLLQVLVLARHRKEIIRK